ncbi:MAG: PaaI family thioesterase [Thermoanaerobaculia bacterium]
MNTIAGPNDLVPLDPFTATGLRRSFVSGDPEGERLRVHYFRTSDGRLVADVWFGPGTEGPPGHAHGGSIAAVLDEAMGIAAWMAGHKAVAAQLVTNFKQMIPLGTTARVETTIGGIAGRKVTIAARVRDAAGLTLAEAEGLFVTLAPEAVATMERMIRSA